MSLVRIHPENPCAPDGEHHPHRWVCDDPDNCGYTDLRCCMCNEDWPCVTKRRSR